MKRLMKFAFSLVTLSTCAVAIQTFAQGSAAEERDLSERSFHLRLLSEGKQAKKSKSSEDPKKILGQVQEDFSRIQLIDNELIEALRTGAADTILIGKSVAEINMRAVRLMENLTESKLVKKAGDSVELLTDNLKVKESLYTLDSVIAEFAD